MLTLLVLTKMQKSLLSFTVNISNKIIRSYVRQRRVQNPGVQNQLSILDEKELDTNIDLDEFESDFMNIGDMERMHSNELEVLREKEKYWIVKQKYFKEEKYNFLTWNDKEQIQHLHQSNPEEWTIEKLSEGFPASPDTIKKIIKNNWSPKNVSKKINHDKSVERNWKFFREGKFDNTLPEELKNHLKKFSSRKQRLFTENQNKISIVDKPKSSEFSSIVQNLKHRTNDDKYPKNEMALLDRETRIINDGFKLFGRKNVTLSMVKPKTDVKVQELSHNLENSSKDIIQSNSIVQNSEVSNNENKSQITKYNIKQTKLQLENKNSNNITTYPERITIPKGIYKKGYIYKVNDCFYDDDGQFLYRVPGLY